MSQYRLLYNTVGGAPVIESISCKSGGLNQLWFQPELASHSVDFSQLLLNKERILELVSVDREYCL